MLKLARTSYGKVGFQIYLAANVTRRTEKNRQNEDGWQERLVLKVPKMLQSGFKSSWTWTRGRGKPREGPRPARGGCRTNEVSCHCHKESGAAVTWRLGVNGDKWFVQGRAAAADYSAENGEPHFLTRASKASSRNAKSSLSLWDGDEERADRIRRGPGILSNSIREGRNRNSPHRRAALTLATVWGIFRADAAPRLYFFLISCFISQVGRLECGCGTDSSGEASQTWRESNPSLEVKVATLLTRKTFSIFRLYYRKTQ